MSYSLHRWRRRKLLPVLSGRGVPADPLQQILAGLVLGGKDLLLPPIATFCVIDSPGGIAGLQAIPVFLVTAGETIRPLSYSFFLKDLLQFISRHDSAKASNASDAGNGPAS